MKLFTNRLLAAVLVVFASLAWLSDAEARRMGGGKSIGRQSNVTQRNATPPAAAPANAASQAAARGATGSRWMAPLAGLAAGLGLAALANWMGFGEGLANFMMIALLAVGALMLFRFFMARRAAGASQGGPRPAMAGAYGQGASPTRADPMRFQPMATPDAAGPAAAGLGAVAAPGSSHLGSVPADFDEAAFVRTAKVQFVRLQAANDAGDLNDLREFTSPEMYAELKLDIDARGGQKQRTDVVTLDAELLGIENTAAEYLAHVRFHGMIREEAAGEEAQPFDEVWLLAKPAAGGGWVLAGITQRS